MDFQFQNIPSASTGSYRVGVNQETGEIISLAGSYDTGEKYSNTANYIVFRDIDLGYRLWTPKMFHGTMTGAKAIQSGETLWNDGEINTHNPPVISHVSINQNQPIVTDEYYGVGFFAAIIPKDGGPETVSVKNIELNEVSVNNSTTTITVSPSLVSILLSSVGGGLGTALDLALKVLTGVDYNLKNQLSDLLDAELKAPYRLATGTFAGILKGKAEIEDCAVTGTVSVTSVNDRTGGFVGYSDGEEKYGVLSGALGSVVNALADILNVVPGIGLGDLVTILLNNAVPLGNLVPVAYDNPVIRNCEVDGLAGGIGQLDTSFNGGFIGQQTGTIIENCQVKNSNYIVQTEQFGGGFAGIARDEAIRSTLGDLGLEFPNLLRNIQPKSLLKECEINNSTVTVNGTDNLGGFTGALCSSYAVNCSILGQEDNYIRVIGSGDNVGGFCGEASLGWLFVGNDENKASLLSTVGSIVINLTGDKKSALLSLAGAEPSAIMGVNMDCGEIEVSGRKYVGGILGRGDGVYITESSDENLQNLAFWKYDKFPSPEESEVRDNYVNNLKGVVASDSYAGGIAGSVGTASAASLLNTTLGLADLIGFDVSNVTVNGIEGGYTVAAANNCAGGGFGETIGGTIDNVALNELKLVSADNRAAGFTGRSGPGDLAGSEGLSLHLLGLDNVLEAKNLLSLGQGVEVEITNCNVNGIESGFVVQSTHDTQPSDTYQYTAGGFAAKSNSTKIENSHVHNLLYVSADDKKGYAGGYVGYMLSGVITNGQGYDAKLVRAMRSAGGFAGKMQTGGAADFGGVSVLGLNLSLGSLLSAVSLFVPTVKSSSIKGWQSGLTVMATGDDFIHKCGYAGGYVGSAYGAQIWGDENIGNTAPTGCNVTNLKFVQGRNAIGGYAGLATAASVADVNTNASSGILQSVLNSVLQSPGDLAQVVQATVTTIRQAEVSAYDTKYGFSIKPLLVSVNGNTQTYYAQYAGGFAGTLEAAIIGKESDTENKIKVTNLREVDGGYYAGGFFGLADVTSAAAISNSGDEQASVLGLVKAQKVSVLDAFRTYIYHAEVVGTEENFVDAEENVIAHEGVIVRAHNSDTLGLLDSTIYSGCAGGFGGGMMNGTVKNSSVSNVNTVTGLNYVGGFIGHLGRGGAVDADGIGLLDLIDLSAGVLEVFGSVNENCTVEGIDAGMVVLTGNGTQSVSGGFVGFSDISNVKNRHVTKQKQVYSDQIAGGFVGKTEMSYLINVQASSFLVNGLLEYVVNPLLRALYIGNLQNLPLPTIAIPGLENILSVSLLSDGNTLALTLLGLPISVALIKSADPNTTDTAVIRLGGSEIRLPCTQSGGVNSNDVENNENANVVIHLLKGNYARVTDSTVKGIAIGYDVYGGGATNESAGGSDENGYAGGFVGYNNKGRLLNDQMIYCDVVKGYAGKTGHFSGCSVFDTVYDHGVSDIEQRDKYSVYRSAEPDYAYALNSLGSQIGAQRVSDTETGTTYNRYDVVHRASPIEEYADWENAVMSTTSTSGGTTTPINVYASSSKAVLMLDTPTELNGEGIVPDPDEYADPCERVLTYKNLAIRKAWDDDDDFNKKRPESIKVRIWQYNYYDENRTQEILDEDGNSTKMIYRKLDGTDSDGFIEISKTVHGTENDNIWQYIIQNLPATSESLPRDDETGDISIIYYFYRIEEISVEGYTTTVSYNTSGPTFLINITNSIKSNLLPNTGGRGVMTFILIGFGIFIFALYRFIRVKLKYYITYVTPDNE